MLFTITSSVLKVRTRVILLTIIALINQKYEKITICSCPALHELIIYFVCLLASV